MPEKPSSELKNHDPIKTKKTEFRETMRDEKFLAFGNNDMDYLKQSGDINHIIMNLPMFIQAEGLAFFMAKEESYEPFTDKVIQQAIAMSKKVYIPRCITETKTMEFVSITDTVTDTAFGSYGVREPKNDLKSVIESDLFHNIDLIFVPGLAFDVFGNRMGYGAGYYDRFLERMLKSNPTIKIIGLGFSFQLFNEEIPHETHDSKVNYVITENGLLKTRYSVENTKKF